MSKVPFIPLSEIEIEVYVVGWASNSQWLIVINDKPVVVKGFGKFAEDAAIQAAKAKYVAFVNRKANEGATA